MKIERGLEIDTGGGRFHVASQGSKIEINIKYGPIYVTGAELCMIGREFIALGELHQRENPPEPKPEVKPLESKECPSCSGVGIPQTTLDGSCMVCGGIGNVPAEVTF